MHVRSWLPFRSELRVAIEACSSCWPRMTARTRLSFNIGPGGQILIPTEVDYSQEFGPSSHDAWDAEYARNIAATGGPSLPLLKEPKPAEASVPGCTLPYDFLGEFEKMEPVQRQLILDELAERFRRSMEISNAVFDCVDKIDVRRLIWEAVKDIAPFYADGRMSAVAWLADAPSGSPVHGSWQLEISVSGAPGEFRFEIDEIRYY